MSDLNTQQPLSATRSRKSSSLGDSYGIVARYLLRGVLEKIDMELGDFLMRLSRRSARELAQRDRERPRGDSAHWFTREESELVGALANVIVPSDENTPGAANMGVLGVSAVEALDRVVANSPQRQSVYRRGLFALDELARLRHEGSFVALAPEDQVNLLKFVEALYQDWSKPEPLTGKFRKRLLILQQKWRGQFPAIDLFPVLIRDVMQVFYTNPVSWIWLGYDGPPMPEGYPDLRDRRSAAHQVDSGS